MAKHRNYQQCHTCGCYIKKDKDNPVQFCSVACKDKYRQCINCHRPFIITLSQRHYCSADCKVRYILKKFGSYKYVMKVIYKSKEI